MQTSLFIPLPVRSDLKTLAKKENRSMSNMASILLRQAMIDRTKAVSNKTPH